jgi:Na+/H+ antiporter NhaD/arsenite permease-like protein
MAGSSFRSFALTSLWLLAGIGLWLMSGATVAWAEEGGAHFVPPVWTVLPFAGILLSIALFPLLAPHFWEHQFPKVSAFWLAVALLCMFVSVPEGSLFIDAYGAELFKTYAEYVSFIILLGSLFVISGGIYISGNLPGRPMVNTVMLGIGTLLASLIGTTGAAMLLIRPLIRSNEKRRSQVHLVIFFIFLVCNVGGSLTPVGDPPLFLGFLKGVPFEWTVLQLMPEWAFTSAILLGLFFAIDTFLIGREGGSAGTGKVSIRIEGGMNILLLAGVVGAVILSGILQFEHPGIVTGLGTISWNDMFRDGGQILLALLSIRITAKIVRQNNNFHYGPIKEVAYLFVGIFTTMMPALMLLNARGAELGITSPVAYYWASGALSSFLDNAPTYLTFLATAMGSFSFDHAIQMTQDPAAAQILKGISLGSVFMGANTYIGNGPNFMVKAIAEGAGVKMPSFFGYMLWSGLILLPLFFLVGVIFL